MAEWWEEQAAVYAKVEQERDLSNGFYIDFWLCYTQNARNAWKEWRIWCNVADGLIYNVIPWVESWADKT